MYKKFLLPATVFALNLTLTQAAYSSDENMNSTTCPNAPVFDSSNNVVHSENMGGYLSPSSSTPGLIVPCSENNKEEQSKLIEAAIENMSKKDKS